jgi:hypothetical protein
VATATVVSILAASMGEEGAALGTVVGESVLACGYLWALTRNRPDMRPPLRSAARSVLAAAVALAAGLLLGLGPGVDTAVALVLFALLLLVLRAVPPDLLALLPEPLRRRVPGGAA